MTDDKAKRTQILIKDDTPTGITSQAHGANINSIGFNVDFIASNNPTLALTILKAYAEARTIQPGDPAHPEEDYSLVLEQIKDLLN